MDVVEDTNLSIEGVGIFSKFGTDMLPVIFINISSHLPPCAASQGSSVSETYAYMRKEPIQYATCVEDSVIPFRPPFPIFFAVCSPNCSAFGRDSVPAACLVSADKCTGEKDVLGFGRQEH